MRVGKGPIEHMGWRPRGMDVAISGFGRPPGLPVVEICVWARDVVRLLWADGRGGVYVRTLSLQK